MSEKAKAKIGSMIESFASSLMMLDLNVKNDVDEAVASLKKLAEVARKEEFNGVADIVDFVGMHLSCFSPEKAEKEREMVDFSITAMREFLAAGPGPTDEGRLQSIKDEADGILGINDFAAALMSSIQEQEVPEFLSNAISILQDIEDDVLALEKNAGDHDKVNAVFRAFHTLKGEAGLLGIKNISTIAHGLEDIMEKVRSGRSSFDKEKADFILSMVDELKEVIKVYKNDLGKGRAYDVSIMKGKIEIFAGPFEKEPVLEKPKPHHEEKQPKAVPEKGKENAQEESIPAYAMHVPVLDLSEGTDLFFEFISEANDHLVSAEEALLVLESDPENKEEVNRIFRAFHTIKGLASFLNLEDLRVLTHETETMMDAVRKGSLKLDTAITDAILGAIDASRKLLALLKEQVSNNGVLAGPYHDITNILAVVRGIMGKELPRSAAAGKKEEPKLGEILVQKEIIDEFELKEALVLQEEKEPEKKIGEILVDIGAATESQVARGLDEQEQKKAISAGVEETVKIDVKKLDDLIDMMGELVITWTQVAQSDDIVQSENFKLIKDVSQLERTVTAIQHIGMSLRLVPIRPVFQKMSRLVRDLSRKADKDIRIKLSGEETQIDKNMIELLGDPLIHMIRNSVDHGVENKEKRIAAGKNPQGTVELNAYHKGGSIMIEIKDDGGGLNKEKILAKAIDRGLLKVEDTPTENRIYNMIFEPGFSTADKITDVSGRGVGMDVVKRNIERMRGRIDIQTEAGKGTTFTIKLPLTLAIIDGIILGVGEERYIAPIFSVVEFMQPRQEDITLIEGKGELIMFHGNLFPVIRLDRCFKVRSAFDNIEKTTGCIVESDYGQVCLIVDELIGQQQIVIKSLGDKLKDVKGVVGGTILGDGRVGLIIDVNGIVVKARE